MTRPAGHVGTVVPLRRSSSSHRGRIHKPDLDIADAARSFDLVERCARKLQPAQLAVTDKSEGFDRPIVIFQVELPGVEQWLDQLERIDPADWQDTRWVLRRWVAAAGRPVPLTSAAAELPDLLADNGEDPVVAWSRRDGG
jgi:hypothetical protein